jgi:hypothetical protein
VVDRLATFDGPREIVEERSEVRFSDQSLFLNEVNELGFNLVALVSAFTTPLTSLSGYLCIAQNLIFTFNLHLRLLSNNIHSTLFEHQSDTQHTPTSLPQQRSATANTMTNLESAISSHEQHDQSQQPYSNTSSASTSDTEAQGFEAATAVLDTNELLHLIVSEVPR